MGCTTSTNGHINLRSDSARRKANLKNRGSHTPVRIRVSNDNLLTENEKRLIRETWAVLRTMETETLGKKIFMHIFDQHPPAKGYFSFRDVPTDKLTLDKNFSAHALRFVQIIESHVTNLDDLRNQVIPILRNLGRFHVRHGEWFSATNFNLFMDSILLTWEEELGDLFTPETKEAWAMLLDFLVQGMTEGFNMERNSATET